MKRAMSLYLKKELVKSRKQPLLKNEPANQSKTSSESEEESDSEKKSKSKKNK